MLKAFRISVTVEISHFRNHRMGFQKGKVRGHSLYDISVLNIVLSREIFMNFEIKHYLPRISQTAYEDTLQSRS